jgi:hypothetical protein
MFLRHIQLIFSLLVKTWKIEKCFVARNNYFDKLACWFQHPHDWKHSVDRSSYASILSSRKGGASSRAETHVSG